MAKYSVSSASAGTQQALSTTYKTLLSLTSLTGASTLRRGWIYDVEFGAAGKQDEAVLQRLGGHLLGGGGIGLE